MLRDGGARVVLFLLIESNMRADSWKGLCDEVAVYPLSSYGYARTRAEGFHLFAYDRREDAHHAPDVPHRHDFIQLVWLRRGAGEFVCDLSRRRFGDSTLFLLPAGSPHAWRHDRDPEGFALGLAPRFLNTDALRPGLLGRLAFLRAEAVILPVADAAMAEELEAIFRRMQVESEGAEEGREDVLRAWVVILLSKVRRLVGPAGEGGVLGQRFHLALDQHLPRLQRVADYARLLGVSRTHLNEELRRTTGRTASDLIHERLTLEAKRLLAHTDSPAAKIAYRLNFKDPSYFGRFFRAATGVSPLEFRRRHGLGSVKAREASRAGGRGGKR
jgi:AraC family transcriptional activator of pobA